MRLRGIAIVLAGIAAVGAGLHWLPGYRMEREAAAARREGVWTETGDVRRAIAAHLPKGENAAPFIRAAIAETKARRTKVSGLEDNLQTFLKGKGTEEADAQVRGFVSENPDLIASWQRAAACPRLDYGRSWEQGYAVLMPELMEVKWGARLLTAVARMGLDPKANLLAAARLGVLTGQEPDLIAQLVRVAIGHLALREAEEEGLGQTVEAALGPPIDLRWAYASEPAFTISTMRQIGGPEWNRTMGSSADDALVYRLRRMGSGKDDATIEVVREYRALWRELPKDGTDYAAAIPVVARHNPRIVKTMGSISAIMAALAGDDEDQTMTQPLKSFAKLEAERKAVREGRPLPPSAKP